MGPPEPSRGCSAGRRGAEGLGDGPARPCSGGQKGRQGREFRVAAICWAPATITDAALQQKPQKLAFFGVLGGRYPRSRPFVG